MAEIKLYKSPWRGIKMIVASSVFVAIGIWMIKSQPEDNMEYYMGWASVVFFGLCGLIGFYVIFDRRPQITVTENGVWDRMAKQSEIKWEQFRNARLLNIYGQKFVAVLVTEDFIFRKKPPKWVSKLNKTFGASEINLNLSQIRIDENAFSDLLNKIAKADKGERSNIIRSFGSKLELNSGVNLTKYLYFALIVALIWTLSLYSFIFFWIIFGIMGVGALIAKAHWGSTSNSKLRKYSETITFLGFSNLVLIFFTIKSYDYAAESVGKNVVTGIENYKQQHHQYPKDISSIINNADFNFIEQHIADKIQYKTNGKDYVLKLEYLNDNEKEFDTLINEWD